MCMDALWQSRHTAPMTDPWPSADPLGEALHFLRMRGVFYCRCQFTNPWALALPAFEDCMMFHVVTAGECRIEVHGAPTKLLRPGGLALVPHGRGHRLASAAGLEAARLFDLPREQVGERYELLHHGGGGDATTVICGVVRFDHAAARQLIGLLPRLIEVDVWSAPEAEWLQSTLRLMAAEATAPRAGGETVITRLADILVIQSIRAWIERAPDGQFGWLSALRDPQIGRAIALIHRDPSANWTLQALAAAVGMSRSAFAARFTALVGEPAMQYATRWKMQTARIWLQETTEPLSWVADRLGYQSDAAFSRAFKRTVGVAPGALRRRGVALPEYLRNA